MNRVITQTADLETLAPDWWDLWRRCPAATPFQTPAWLIAWWRHFAPGALRVVAIYDSRERLTALAPCYVEESSARLLPLGISLSDHLDVLVASDTTADAQQALVNTMLAGSGCARWEFEECHPAAAALRLAAPAGWDDSTHPQSACPVLALDAAPEHWLDVVPARRRHQFRRALTLAQKRGAVAIVAVPPDGVQTFLDDLFRLHAARWASRDEPGVLGDARVQAFQRDVTPAMMQHGLARLFTVTIGGTLAGCYYGFAHRQTGFAYLGGFDPDFAYESPGALLLGHAIGDAARQGVTAFDFLRGQESYKYGWGAVDQWNVKRTFVRRAQ